MKIENVSVIDCCLFLLCLVGMLGMLLVSIVQKNTTSIVVLITGTTIIQLLLMKDD